MAEGAEPEFQHAPVMRDEVTALLAPVPAGTIVDATLGGAGHARALLAARPDCTLVGIDQDPAARAAAEARLAADPETTGRYRVVAGNFRTVAEALAGVDDVVFVLFDLGVSSHQLDVPGRGFSYRFAGPLDMRMDPDGPTTAADIVNSLPERALMEMLFHGGEDRFAGRIAQAIVRERAAEPITTTERFADIVRNAIPQPARRYGGDPAKRSFQAVRIAVNDELGVLDTGLRAALDLLVPGGRVVVLSYHSGEDRLVKSVLTDAATGGCVCPPGLPCVCGAVPRVRLLNKGARKASAAEIEANPRSESVRLRAAELLP